MLILFGVSRLILYFKLYNMGGLYVLRLFMRACALEGSMYCFEIKKSAPQLTIE